MGLQEVRCVGYGLDRTGSGQGQVAGTCDFDNESPGSTKCVEFLDQLKTCQLLKKGTAPWSKYGVCKLLVSLYALMAGTETF